MNIQEIVNDQELYDELVKAYAYAALYKSRVQFRLAILTMPDTHIWEDCIWNSAIGTPSVLVDAISGFINSDLVQSKGE